MLTYIKTLSGSWSSHTPNQQRKRGVTTETTRVRYCGIFPGCGSEMLTVKVLFPGCWQL